MKTILNRLKLLVCCLFFSSSAIYATDDTINSDNTKTGQEALEQVEYAGDTFSRTGEIQPKDLISRYKAFAINYQKYQPSAEELKLFQRLDGFELVVFFGLWCHDSQREIPRLIKLIDQSNTYFKSVKFIALDTDKVLSEKFSSKYEVSNTPTIYVVDNRQIIAKVMERPQGSLSQDLVGQIFAAKQKVETKPQARK